MTVSTFSVATCSNQDFYTNMGSYTRTLLSFARPEDRATLNKVYDMHATNIHHAMGYRAEHSNQLAF
jgi:hypothetical protein